MRCIADGAPCSDITTTEPASYYVGITQSVSYGSTTLFSNEAGIVDTGTTLIYIPSGESPPARTLVSY